MRGWAVDQSAQGWSGIDQVQVFNGAMDQGGQLLATGIVGLDRPDVADALGNPFFTASGFDAVVPAGALPTGLEHVERVRARARQGLVAAAVYGAASGRGSRPGAPQPQPQAQVSRQFSDDPLLVVQAPLPDTVVETNTQCSRCAASPSTATRPANAGVGGSGVSHVTVYLDGDKREGTFLGEATLGKTSRDATGWGERFGTAGGTSRSTRTSWSRTRTRCSSTPRRPCLPTSRW